MSGGLSNKKFPSFLKSPGSLQRIRDSSTNLSSHFSRKSSKLTNFLAVYFDFAYFLCCCPFRLVSDEFGWFTIRSNMAQKICCALFNSSAVILMLTGIRTKVRATASSKNQNPLEYFGLLSSLFTASFQIFTLKRFWINQDDFVHIVNFIRSERNVLPQAKIRIENRLFSRLICTIFAVMPIYEVIWKLVLAPSSTWNKTIWNRALASEARYVFFINGNITESKKVLEPHQYSTLDHFLAFLVGLGWIERYMLGYYIDLLMLFTVLTVWTTSYLFARKLEDDMKKTCREYNWSLLAQTHIPSIALAQNIKTSALFKTGSKKSSSSVSSGTAWADVYRMYQSIRNLCDLVNKSIGTLSTLYLADCILFLSTGMDSVLVTKEVRVKVRLLFFVCNYAFVFLLSADACNQVESLKYWLAKDENRQDIPLDQLNMIMSELQTRMVGIRGSNIFTVTYPLLWNMTTTIVTYFIICLQTRQQGQKEVVTLNNMLANKTQN